MALASIKNNYIFLLLVRNVTCLDIWNAKRCLEQCPYCSDTVVWKSHKLLCPKRKNDTSKDPPETQYYRILVRVHKTSSSRMVELGWSKTFLQLVLDMIAAKELDGEQEPFAEVAYWPKMKKFFIDCLPPNLKKLAADKKFGGKSIRRMVIKRIIDEGEPDMGKKLNNIGTSKDVAFKVSLT